MRQILRPVRRGSRNGVLANDGGWAGGRIPLLTKSDPPFLDKEALLRRSTKINWRVVAAHERLEQKLLKLGVEIKPRYSLEPPLGTNRTRVRNE